MYPAENRVLSKYGLKSARKSQKVIQFRFFAFNLCVFEVINKFFVFDFAKYPLEK